MFGVLVMCAPFVLRTFPRVAGKPCPMATPITLTLALSHRGRGDTICYALPPVLPGHTPLASLRLLAPLSFHERGVEIPRCAWNDGRRGGVVGVWDVDSALI